jgi:hypothetical protein
MISVDARRSFATRERMHDPTSTTQAAESGHWVTGLVAGVNEQLDKRPQGADASRTLSESSMVTDPDLDPINCN